MSEWEAEQQAVSAWRDLLARHATVACELDRVLHEHGLGMSDFEVLDRLVDAGGCVRMHDLAQAVHLSQSALSRLVSRLERDGLVTRTICDVDRRGIVVWLTDLGRQRHAAARPVQRAVLAAHLTGPAAPAPRAAADDEAAAPAPTWESSAGRLALAKES
ncbi:MAG: MarR family transcriptional regulator [Micromonosporaceae bacterium]|jgi:DNA-binding MarR family transcriptional regulator|nr:MarR family transcriptional regulator [Micromonosporaceae bacterium]